MEFGYLSKDVEISLPGAKIVFPRGLGVWIDEYGVACIRDHNVVLEEDEFEKHTSLH